MNEADENEHWLPKKWFVIFWIMSTSVLAYLFWQYQWQVEEQQLTSQLNKVRTNIDAYLGRYQGISRVVASSKEVVAILTDEAPLRPNDPNQYLNLLNERIQSDVVYLMSLTGKVVASSNYLHSDSFLHKDFSFRPYFQRAVVGQHNQYHALGSTSGKIGYYYASPVFRDEELVGVLAIKVDMEFLNSSIQVPDYEFFLHDGQGVIFFSTNPDWTLKTLWSLAPEKMQRIKTLRQYLDTALFSITQAQAEPISPGTVCINYRWGCHNHLFAASDLQVSVGRLYAVRNITHVVTPLMAAFVLYSAAYAAFVFALLYLRARWLHQQTLASANVKLTKEVNFLTQYLQQTNADLHEKVTQYQKAQEALESTQEDLIQAEKMAVLGEVSVGLNHELNQPLLAISAYAENGAKFIQRERYQEAADNLEEIRRICITMDGIISQFKVFAKRDDQREKISIKQVIDDALVIVTPRLKRQGVGLNVRIEANSEQISVMANPIQLQQVIINLVTNAVQAMEQSPSAQVEISVEPSTQGLQISVTDNGPGMAQSELDQIFDPYFSTKPKGLGLGLTLSKRIVDSFHGTIKAFPVKPHGIRFTLTFPPAKDVNK